MDGAKIGLLGLVLACAGAGVLVLAAADKKNEDERKNAGPKPGNTPSRSTETPSATQKSLLTPSDESTDETEAPIHAAQSRLGVPPPGEKRIEAVAPRTIGGGKR